jgi:L-lactate dehydrogenase complex protein LldG
MTPLNPARQAVLDRIRAATGSATPVEPARVEPAPLEISEALATLRAALPRNYIRKPSLDREAILALLTERLHEYDAEVVECTPDRLPETIAAQLLSARLPASKHASFIVPPGLPSAWLDVARTHSEFTLIPDHDLPTDQVENAAGVITASFCAVADSGTIALHHSAAEGRRLITLLPDWFLCILHASQVVQTLPEYFDRCPTRPRLVTWISGPSATADIEMTRIKGVHGPRFLHVLLVRD